MLSMMPVISPILTDSLLMSPIVSTTWPTSALPFRATAEASTDSVFACRALSAFCRTVTVSCSMVETVCCSEEACSSVREDRSTLPAAICAEPTEMALAAPRTAPTISARLRCMAAIDSSTLPFGAACAWGVGARSPDAIFRVISLSTAGSVPSARSRLRVITRPSPTASATDARLTPITMLRSHAARASASCRVRLDSSAPTLAYTFTALTSASSSGLHSALIFWLAASRCPSAASLTMPSATGP